MRVMNRGQRQVALAVAVVFTLAGCFVQSVRPFYTDANRVELPATIAGEWELVREHGNERRGYSPWRFVDERLEVGDEHGNRGRLEAVFFRVGDHLFLDTIADYGDEEGRNRFWSWHTRPMHMVCRVDVAGDQLTLTPLNYLWLVKQEQLVLPYFASSEKDDLWIYTATSAEWEKFLAAHGNHDEAFSAKFALVLRRQTEGDVPTASPPAPGEPQPAAAP